MEPQKHHLRHNKTTSPTTDVSVREQTAETEQDYPAFSVVQRAKVDPRSLTPAKILQLQHTFGNQAVQRIIKNYHQDNLTNAYVARIGEGEGAAEPVAASELAADPVEAEEVEDQADEADVQAEAGLDLSGKSVPTAPAPLPPPRPAPEQVQAAMAMMPPVAPPRPSSKQVQEAMAMTSPTTPPRPASEKIRAWKQSPEPLAAHTPLHSPATQNYNADDSQDYTEYGISAGGAGAGGAGFASKMAVLGGASVAGTAATGLGAAGGLLGVVGAGTEMVRGMQQATNDNLKRGEQNMGMVRYAGNLYGNALQSSASGAVGISHLMGNAGAAAAATTAAASGAIIYGASEIVRGGYGAYKAHQRQQALGTVATSGENGRELQDAAHLAATTQNMRENVGKATVAKGAMLVGGGIALIVAATNPVGWALLGGAAIIGGIAAFARFLAKRRRKKAVAIRVLGVQDEYKQYKEAKAKAEKVSRLKRYERAAALAAVNKRNPLHREMIKAGYEPSAYAKFYADYVNKTANALYQYGVLGKAESSWGSQSATAIGQTRAILKNMGLKVNPDAMPPTPSPEAIGRALHN